MTIRAFAYMAIIAGCAYLAICRSAQAAILATDPVAIPAFQGSRQFVGSLPFPPFTVRFQAKVDYAVYTPGSFQTSTLLGNPTDPSNGLHYVYAYQIYDTAGAEAIKVLSVGFIGDPLADGPGGLPGYFATPTSSDPPGGVPPALAPLQWYFAPTSPPYTSSEWKFFLGAGASDLKSGRFSEILFYTSPKGPTWTTATLGSGTVFRTELLPSPIPEPVAGVALAGLVVTAMCVRRRQ